MVTPASTTYRDLGDTDVRPSQAIDFPSTSPPSPAPPVSLPVLVSCLMDSICFLFPTSCCPGCLELVQREHYHIGNIKNTMLLVHRPQKTKCHAPKRNTRDLFIIFLLGSSKQGFFPLAQPTWSLFEFTWDHLERLIFKLTLASIPPSCLLFLI